MLCDLEAAIGLVNVKENSVSMTIYMCTQVDFRPTSPVRSHAMIFFSEWWNVAIISPYIQLGDSNDFCACRWVHGARSRIRRV
jgi:hypothetical protein